MPEEKNTTIVGDGHDNYAQAAQSAIRAKAAFQASAAEIFCSFVHQTCFCSSLCGTSGSDDNDIICDTLLHQFDMCIVRTDLRIVTSNHSNSTTDNTGSDTLK